jgi:uncharacterized protein (DUF983 family)
MKQGLNLVLAAVAGFFTWWIVATVLDRALRLAWPEYAVAVPTMTFSLSMLLARLVEGALCTLAAGALAAWIGRASSSRRAAVAMAALLLLFFVPTHAMIWSHFPVWYHLTFLGSLAPLTLLGARLVSLSEARRR